VYLVPLTKQFSIDRPLDAREIEQAVSMITGHWRWPDLGFDAEDFRRRVSRLRQPYLSDVAEVVYRWYLEVQRKPRWGDKTPVYIEIVPQLARMFPSSRFIHLVRDGRDVAMSFRKLGWVESRWFHDNTVEWTRALEWHRRWSRSELGDRILQVRYEDLVLETEATVRAICRFLGEEFEVPMLSWERMVDEQLPAREHRFHTKLKQKVGEEGVARWKREMSASETFVCEAFMGAQLREQGYELRFQGPLWAPALAATRMYCRTVLPAVDFQSRAARFFRRRLGLWLGLT
jgi:hypothetical protein